MQQSTNLPVREADASRVQAQPLTGSGRHQLPLERTTGFADEISPYAELDTGAERLGIKRSTLYYRSRSSD